MMRLIAGIAVASLLSSNAWAAECESIKRQYAEVKQESGADGAPEKFIKSIQTEVDAANLCARNLLGRIYYEGVILPRSVERATAIFNDLSNRGYPPAMYNLAYVLIKENQSDPRTIMTFIHGIMHNYYGSKEWGLIASDARELGWDYLAQLERDGPQPELRKMQEHAADVNVLALANRVQARTNAVHRQAEMIGQLVTVSTLLSVGAAVNSRAVPQCDWNSCRPFLSVGDLYNIGVLR